MIDFFLFLLFLCNILVTYLVEFRRCFCSSSLVSELLAAASDTTVCK